ncbi:hypothetical protein EON68_00095, partial [archaeon]
MQMQYVGRLDGSASGFAYAASGDEGMMPVDRAAHLYVSPDTPGYASLPQIAAAGGAFPNTPTSAAAAYAFHGHGATPRVPTAFHARAGSEGGFSGSMHMINPLLMGGARAQHAPFMMPYAAPPINSG